MSWFKTTAQMQRYRL